MKKQREIRITLDGITNYVTVEGPMHVHYSPSYGCLRLITQPHKGGRFIYRGYECWQLCANKVEFL
jgi:hypothetical protein